MFYLKRIRRRSTVYKNAKYFSSHAFKKKYIFTCIVRSVRGVNGCNKMKRRQIKNKRQILMF